MLYSFIADTVCFGKFDMMVTKKKYKPTQESLKKRYYHKFFIFSRRIMVELTNKMKLLQMHTITDPDVTRAILIVSDQKKLNYIENNMKNIKNICLQKNVRIKKKNSK